MCSLSLIYFFFVFTPLCAGVDPLTSTSFGVSHITVHGLDQWSTFKPLVVLGDQTLGHELKMSGTLTFTGATQLVIGPSTAPDSLIHQHVGHTVRETASVVLSITDLNFNAATFAGVSKSKILSLKLGSIQQQPLNCISSAVDELEVQKFITTVADISEPLISGFLSKGIDRVFSQAFHLVFLQYEERMKTVLPNFLTTTGSDLLNAFITDFLVQHTQRYSKTCPAPSIDYDSQEYLDFRNNEFWSQFQNNVLVPFLENDAASLNSLINAATDEGSIHNVLNQNQSKRAIDSGNGFLGDLTVSAGNVGVHGMNTIHDVELLTTRSQHHGSKFAGVDNWPAETNYSLSTALAVGTAATPLMGSLDVYLSVEGGQANGNKSFLNDFTFTVGVSDLEIFLGLLVKMDLGHVSNLQLRHISHLDCWVSTIGSFVLSQAHARVNGSLFAGLKCRHCSSPGFRDLQDTLSTAQASKDLTEIINGVLNFVSKSIESEAVQDQVNAWLEESTQRCTVAADGFSPDGSYQNINAMKGTETKREPTVAYGYQSDAVLDYTLFALLGVSIASVWMCARFYNREKKYQQDLLALEKELGAHHKKMGAKTTNNNTQQQSRPLISATRSLFQSPHVPGFVRYAVPLVLLGNAGFFLSGHLSLGALVKVALNIAGEDIVLPQVFTFSMAQSTIDMWNAGGKMLAVILVVFSGIWPYTKVAISIFLWVVPPTHYAPSSRGAAFMWLDALGKWSIIDIFVLVLSMVGFHLIIESPLVSFLPPNFWLVEVSVVPVWGLYSNLIAQVMSQLVSHVAIYYHRNAVAAVEEETGYKMLDIQSFKKILIKKKIDIKVTNMHNPMVKENKEKTTIQNFDRIAKERGTPRERGTKRGTKHGAKRGTKRGTPRKRASTSWIRSGDNVQGERKALVNKKAALREHYFEMKSDEGEAGLEIGRLRIQVSPCGQWLVVVSIVVAELLLVVGTVTPSFYMNTRGLAGLAIDLGNTNSSFQQYSILTTVGSIASQTKTFDIGSFGLGSIVGLFLLTAVLVPSLQLISLLIMWLTPMSLSGQKKMYLLNEALGAWQYLEVYIIAIGVATLQMKDISKQIAAPLCSDLDVTFDSLAKIGLVDPLDANCFVVQAGIEVGMYVLLVGASILMFINILINKATIAAIQDREHRLRGVPLQGKAERPKSFFRDSCIKYLLFSCCCCLRYVAEDDDGEDGDDEGERSRLSSVSGNSRKRVASLVNQWNRKGKKGKRSSTKSVVNVFVPRAKMGMPPHWEEIVTDEGDVYYWNHLTGESQWEKPYKRSSTTTCTLKV